jgi:hypothetical protein
MKSDWIDYNETKPPIGVEVLAQNNDWIDEDYNEYGIRVGFQNEDEEGYFLTAKWNNYQDCYDTVEEKPKYWKSFS